MRKITIADSLFLDHTKSAFLGGDNIGIGPTYFEWERADAKYARFVTDSDIKNAEGPGQVAWLLEPFFLHPENYFEAMKKPFDAVLTHNRYFASNNRNWFWCPHGGSWINLKEWGVKKKKHNVSILLSEKKSLRGHQLRHEIVEMFRNQIDIFGLDHRVKPIEAYGPYKYSIIIENECSIGYFTEKLIDCISVGTIPVYWGDPNIAHYFYEEGFVLLRYELSSVDRFLSLYNELDYSMMLEANKYNLNIARNYAIVEDNLWKKYPHLFGDSNG